MNNKQEIKDTLEAYAKAYCAKDIDALMNIFASNDDISAIGTGADELFCGQEQLRRLFTRNFEEATATQFEWHWTVINVFNNSALVAISLTIHLLQNDEQQQVPIRWSVVLKKEQSWKWVHGHASCPAMGQNEGKAYPKK